MTKPELLKNLLTNGGYITVVGGKPSNFSKEELDNRRIFFVREGRNEIPSNTRYAILLRFTQHEVTTPIMAECRKKGIPFEFMSTGKMHEVLRDTFQPSETKVPTIMVKEEVKSVEQSQMKQPIGAVNQLIKENADFNCKSIAEEARRILKIAEEKGIKTNHASLAQALSLMRRKAGIRARRPAVKSNITVTGTYVAEVDQNILTLLDDMKASIELLREYLKKTSKNDKLEQIKKILG